MIEIIAYILSSISLTVSAVGLIWIYRCKKSLRDMFGVYGIALLAYALWHFLAHIHIPADTYTHLIVHNLFVILAVVANVYSSCRPDLSIDLNRRKKDERRQHKTSTGDERRSSNRRRSAVMKLTKLKIGK